MKGYDKIFLGAIKIRLAGVLRIGGESEEHFEMAVNGQDEFFIPASGLAGATRAFLHEQGEAKATILRWFGAQNAEGRLCFHDAALNHPKLEVRYGIEVNDQYGVAEDGRGKKRGGMLYKKHYLAAGSEATFYLQGFVNSGIASAGDTGVETDVSSDWPSNSSDSSDASSDLQELPRLFRSIVDGIRRHEITLGSGKSNGYGQMDVEEAKYRILDLKNPDDLGIYLGNFHPEAWPSLLQMTSGDETAVAGQAGEQIQNGETMKSPPNRQKSDEEKKTISGQETSLTDRQNPEKENAGLTENSTSERSVVTLWPKSGALETPDSAGEASGSSEPEGTFILKANIPNGLLIKAGAGTLEKADDQGAQNAAQNTRNYEQGSKTMNDNQPEVDEAMKSWRWERAEASDEKTGERISRPIIPATTIRGLLRAYGEKVAAFFQIPDESIKTIFGFTPDSEKSMDAGSGARSARGAALDISDDELAATAESSSAEAKKMRSMVTAQDCVIKNYVRTEYHRIKVDRWTGGTISGAKLTQGVLSTALATVSDSGSASGVESEPSITLTVRVNPRLKNQFQTDRNATAFENHPAGRLDPEESERSMDTFENSTVSGGFVSGDHDGSDAAETEPKSLYSLACGLVFLALRDLGLGLLPVGSGNNVGYGRLHGTELRAVIEGTEEVFEFVNAEDPIDPDRMMIQAVSKMDEAGTLQDPELRDSGTEASSVPADSGDRGRVSDARNVSKMEAMLQELESYGVRAPNEEVHTTGHVEDEA